MARLYPPVTEEVLSAFCLTYNNKGEKTGASINISFNLNRAVATAEVGGMALRLRTISTNQYVVTENISINEETKKSEGLALSYNLSEGTCTFQITNTYNPEKVDLLKVGQYYKAQIAFLDLNGVVGYWSTVATIKCVARPSVTIANFVSNDANIFTNEIVGEYKQDTTTGDSSEKVYSYRFQLFDTNENLLEDTGVQLHNSSADISSNSSTDIFYCYKELNDNEIYYIEYSITTINGLSISSPRYQIINVQSIDPEEDIGLIVYNGLEEQFIQDTSWHPWEEGVIKLYLEFNDPAARRNGRLLTGNFVILRSSSRDNFQSWQEVRRFRLNGVRPSQKIMYDYTVEQGVSYRYAVQQFNRQSFYSRKIYSYKRDSALNILYKDGSPVINEVKADFEDMFLYDGERQLKIRFNPKVSSFKNDLQEQKIDTIGSKHPFIFRNGNVCYKEFPVAGLISFQQDNALFFISKDDSAITDDYRQMQLERFEIPDGERQTRFSPKFIYTKIDSFIRKTDLPVYQFVVENKNLYDNNKGHENYLNPQVQDTKTISYYKRMDNYEIVNQLQHQGVKFYKKSELITDNPFDSYSDIYRSETYNKNDLTSENIATERYFKLAVLDWLTDGKPKLFRSPTEGNYIVRLLNVSFTPKTELGRMLHEFTCTAYEVADFNYQSLIDLGLLKINDIQETDYQWYASNVKDIFSLKLGEKDEHGDKYYSIDLENKELYGFSCTGFAPGDKIKLIMSDEATPTIITIGQTGTYIYEDSKGIISISISPQNGTEDFPRSFLIATKGYNFQAFDTMASITTHTQIGEQIVGRVDNYFQINAVNTGNDIADSQYAKQVQPNRVRDYWHGNNVYLLDSFEPVVIDKDAYDKNWYYILNDKGKYILPLYTSKTSSHIVGQKQPYSSSQQYYKRNFEGVKIKVAEILHLHAKRREVIPIFMYQGDNNYTITDQTLPKAKFMLTPFGNGYVRYKSILPQQENYTWKYSQLTTSERTKAMNVHDLVEFVIQKCALDQFCLFQVYVPVPNEVTGKTDWEPYANTGTNAVGIFDPYLYETEIKNNSAYKYAGWWIKRGPETEEYDPSFTIGYGEDNENTIVETISLADKPELTLDNIKTPTYLSTGNGVVIELIYRLQCIDYSIENENSQVKGFKNIFLTTQKDALDKIAQYRTAQYSKIAGNILYDKYNELAVKIRDYENYKTVVKSLTEAARLEQINKIKTYLGKERDLVNSILMQLYGLDLDLIETLGEEYETRYSFFSPASQFPGIRENYLNFINDALTQTTDLIPTVKYYEDGYFAPQAANADAEQKINIYMKNITLEESAWNFFVLIENVAQQIHAGFLDRQNEIINLGTKQYVSQYLDFLQDEGQQVFFKTEEGIPTCFPNNYPIGEWLNKKQPVNSLKKTNIKSSTWGNYFHVAEGDVLLPNLADPILNTETNKYEVPHLEEYYPNNIFGLDQTTSKLYTENIKNASGTLTTKTILATIKNQLSAINTAMNSTNTEENYYEVWGLTWDAVKPNGIELYEKANMLPLGVIEKTGSVCSISKSWLETIIDNGYLDGSLNNNATVSNISSFLNNYSRFSTLPNSLKQNLSNIVYQYIHSGIRDLFVEAYTIYAYEQEHLSELSSQQISLINTELTTYKNNIENKAAWATYLQVGSDANSALEKLLNSTNGNTPSLKRWAQDYNNVNNQTNIDELLTVLKASLTNFNTIVGLKNNAISEFTQRRAKINTLENDPNITVSDNIKDILWEEKEAYYGAYQDIEELKELLEKQYNLLQKTYNYTAYREFLESYIRILYSSEKMMTSAECQQYLQEAAIMRDAVIDEEFEPTKQHERIMKAWKDFLDSLAEVYKIEIKERFG